MRRASEFSPIRVGVGFRVRARLTHHDGVAVDRDREPVTLRPCIRCGVVVRQRRNRELGAKRPQRFGIAGVGAGVHAYVPAELVGYHHRVPVHRDGVAEVLGGMLS